MVFASSTGWDSLVGYNMSLRREAFGRFESRLKPYWQFFELDACLQTKARGYRVRVDFANTIEHHPTNTAYTSGRKGNLAVKVYHLAYNYSFVLSKHSSWWLRPWRPFYLFGLGTVESPGVLASFVAVKRYNQLLREVEILWTTWRYTLAGWSAGGRARRT
jgi:hypothetical protein